MRQPWSVLLPERQIESVTPPAALPRRARRGVSRPPHGFPRGVRLAYISEARWHPLCSGDLTHRAAGPAATGWPGARCRDRGSIYFIHSSHTSQGRTAASRPEGTLRPATTPKAPSPPQAKSRPLRHMPDTPALATHHRARSSPWKFQLTRPAMLSPRAGGLDRLVAPAGTGMRE